MAIRIAAAPLMVSETVIFFEVDAVEGDLEVAQRVDRHADAADLAFGQRIVRVEADLRRQVEGDVETGLAVGDQVLEALVGVRRLPKPAYWRMVHGCLRYISAVDAARERVLAGIADHLQPPLAATSSAV
jgi:hypothetical protein